MPSRRYERQAGRPDAHRPASRTSRSEYFLYTAIIAETALAAFVYKVIVQDTELRYYLTALYFGFLAWAIFQLNRLHRKRKLEPAPEPEATAALPEAVAVLENSPPGRRIFGLTAAQFLIILATFVAALMTFTRLLSNLNYER